MSDLQAEIVAALHEEPASEESAPSPDVQTDETPAVSAPSDAPDTTATDAPAITQDTSTATDSKATGPIPFERHQAILENARRKAAEEAKAGYAWVDQFGDQTTIQQYAQLANALNADPVSFARNLLQVANIDPSQLVPQVHGQPAKNGRPDPDVLLDNGQMTYSHEGLQRLLEWERQEAVKTIQADFQPMLQAYEMAVLTEKGNHKAAQQLKAASQWTGFTEHKSQIRDLLKANPQMTLEQAYITAIGGSVRDAEKRAYDKALADLQRKAQSAGTPSPRSAGAPSSSPSPMSIRDAVEAAFRGELDT